MAEIVRPEPPADADAAIFNQGLDAGIQLKEGDDDPKIPFEEGSLQHGWYSAGLLAGRDAVAPPIARGSSKKKSYDD